MLLCFKYSGVEKENDDFTSFFHHKVNKCDTCRDLLVVEKRLEKLQDAKRVPRHYNKSNEAYWFKGGKQVAAASLKRKALEQAPPPVPPPPISVMTELSRMTVADLSELLSELFGKKVGKRSKTVLINQILQEQGKRAE